MSTKTTHLKLDKPDYADAADISVINADLDKIDTAVKGVQDSISNNSQSGELDCNDLPTGIHYLYNASANKPTSVGGMCLCSSVASNRVQLFISNGNTPFLSIRRKAANSDWSEWKTIG